LMVLAGMCARRRTYLSLLRQRKVGQRKTTLLSVSPSLRYGATCDARSRGVPQNSLRAARYAQTTAASQFTKAGVLRRQPAPRPALLGTARREGGTVRAIAALGLVRGASSAGPSAAMARVGLFTPLWLRLGRGACGVSVGVAAPTHRCLTCRGCLNGAPQARSEFCGTPRKRPDPGLPRSSSVGVADLGACSLPPFLHEQERRSPAGASPGQPLQKEELPTPYQQALDAKINCNLTPINYN
jgi:hypothetical protein